MTKDPLSLAQETLERYFEQSPGMRRAMGLAIKNVDAYTKARGTKAVDVNAETDTPGLKLLPIAMPTNANFSSNTVMLDYVLQVLVNTGDQRITAKLLPVVWSVYAAIVAAIESSTLLGLTLEPCVAVSAAAEIKAYHYVKNFTFSNVQAGLSNPQENRGIEGFSAICDLQLHLIFPASFVREWNNASN